MKIESIRRKKPIRTAEVLLKEAAPPFEFRPEGEFTGADVRDVVSDIIELFETEWSSSFQATYLTACIFPEVTPELREIVKAKVQEHRRDLTSCLSDGLRRDNAAKFFYAYLAELAITLPDETPTLQSAWEAKGAEAAKAKLEHVTFQRAWGTPEGDFHWNGIAHLGLLLFDFPELRDMVTEHLNQSSNAQGVSLGEALEKQIQRPFSNIAAVELRALRRVSSAYQGDMTTGMLSASQVEDTYQVFKGFKRIFGLRDQQVEGMLTAARSLQLLTAPRLAFPDDGVVQPVWTQPLTQNFPLPERLKL